MGQRRLDGSPPDHVSYPSGGTADIYRDTSPFRTHRNACQASRRSASGFFPLFYPVPALPVPSAAHNAFPSCPASTQRCSRQYSPSPGRSGFAPSFRSSSPVGRHSGTGWINFLPMRGRIHSNQARPEQTLLAFDDVHPFHTIEPANTSVAVGVNEVFESSPAGMAQQPLLISW